MQDLQIKRPMGATTKKDIVGRGTGCNKGKTCGRGTKGQKARSSPKPGFEGGQMPLFRRLPQRGFSNHPFKKENQTINLLLLEKCFAEGEIVNRDSLVAKNLIKPSEKHFKILGTGEISKKITVEVKFISEAAKQKIEKAGGTVKILLNKEETKQK